MRYAMTAAAVLVAGFLAGCNVPSPGTTRHLGAVDYGSAFATAREVMSENFSIASADPDTGLIAARPKKIEASNERILSGSPARQLATMQLRRKEGGVTASAAVAVQREGSAVYRTIPLPGENYDEVPDKTPAEMTAATTPDQNEAWRTEKYDHALERKMLDQLYKALHPATE